MWRLNSRLGLILLLAVSAREGSCFVPSTIHIRKGANGACYMSGGQQFKGFGKEATKKEGAPKSSSPENLTKEDIENVMTGPLDSLPPLSASAQPTGKQVANKAARQEPVNLDGSAMLDVGWVKQSFDTVMSEEWKKAGKEERAFGEDVCKDCGGTGRIQGGLGILPGLEWWPIKAFRPCPECEKAGRSYSRRGQVLDEVLFGKTDMPIDYKAQPDQRGLSVDDVKRIMQKKSKKDVKK